MREVDKVRTRSAAFKANKKLCVRPLDAGVRVGVSVTLPMKIFTQFVINRI